jgi:hypothetical protein
MITISNRKSFFFSLLDWPFCFFLHSLYSYVWNCATVWDGGISQNLHREKHGHNSRKK